METKILFVCLGNICRSPTAQGVFEKLIDDEKLANRFFVDSAGTHAYHVGEPPDRRSQEAALRRGIDLSKQRARRVADGDFHQFDYIVAMDADNYASLASSCPVEHQGKLSLFMQHAPELKLTSVPDPYYGGLSGFEKVLDLVEAAAAGLLERIRQEKGL